MIDVRMDDCTNITQDATSSSTWCNRRGKVFEEGQEKKEEEVRDTIESNALSVTYHEHCAVMTSMSYV